MNEAGATTTTRYTVFDKVSSVTLPNGGMTCYTYNTQMEPITVTNADGHTWQLSYDLDGSIVKEIDYNGLITQSRTTPDKLRLDVTTGAGTMTTMFDPYGRMTETFDDQGNTTTYQRDALGKITKITNQWCTTDYSYDEYGRSLMETTTLYSGESHTMAFSYGRLGGVEAITHMLPDGKTVSETPMFDDEGVLRNSTYTLGDTEVASLSFGVDDTGRRSWAHVGSIVRSFDYDQNHRLVRDRVHALTPGNNSNNNSYGPVNTATGLNDAGSAGSSQQQDEHSAVGVIDRVFTWRADDVITQITDRIRGVETSYDVDPMGRVTRVTHQHAGSTATQNMPQTREKRAGREESYSYSQAGVLTKLHPDTATRWADDVESYGGTMPRQVGRTRFAYDKAGRVTQTVTKRLSKKPLVKHFYYDNGTQPVGYEDSDHPGVGWRYLYDGVCRRVGKEQINTATGEVMSRVMFLHEGDVLFGEYHTVNTMDPHMVGSAVLWPTDPGTGEILGQITINTISSVTGHGGNGYYPGGNGGTGGHNSADGPCNQHNNPHGGYSDGSYNHNDSTTDGAGGVLGWSQQRVDAVFYSMVCDLAGAPKELINPTTGEVVGYATYTLFGKRHWAGTVSTPLLFTGQYEDTESGWVYNRFRYYDPHAGVYNAQDPLGLLANLGTAQGYVTNPVIWVDVLGLQSCENNRENNELWEKLEEERGQHDKTVPLDHIVDGEVKDGKVFGMHSFKKQTRVADMIKSGEARLPPGGKTFFPEFKNGDEGLKEWLSGDGGDNKGVVDDIIFHPDRVEPNGRWGTVLYKKVTLPDEAIVPKDFKPNSGSKTVELAVYIGNTRQHDPHTFKINSVFPVQGDGVTEVLADGTIADKGFPPENPVGDGNG